MSPVFSRRIPLMSKKLNDYYKQKQYIARVDKKGNITGKIEKWEAHRKGILHKAFTIAIFYKGDILLQHRKHPAFNGVFDATISSHQLFINEELEDTSEASLKTLKREWNISKNDLVRPLKDIGSVYYKAKDAYSEYIEHEVCSVVVAEIKTLKVPNLDFAYGYSVIPKKELKNKKSRTYQNLAPWVKVMIEKNLL